MWTISRTQSQDYQPVGIASGNFEPKIKRTQGEYKKRLKRGGRGGGGIERTVR